jgi:hypothetical protein
MDSRQTLKQIVEFHKSAIENTYSVMTNLTEQNDKMLRSFVDQAHWIPEEGRNLIKEWGDVYRKGAKDLKKAAEENYKMVLDYIDKGLEAKTSK